MNWYCHCGGTVNWEAEKDIIALVCSDCDKTIAVAIPELLHGAGNDLVAVPISDLFGGGINATAS